MMYRGARAAGPLDARTVRLMTLLLAGLVPLLLLAAVFAAPANANPIQVENSLPGTTAWELPGATPTTIPDGSPYIDGYASESSVQPGDVLHMHVSTNPAASYRIEVYRLGWYQGMGGRLVACLPSCANSEPGAQRPVAPPDPATGYLDAGWPVTDTIGVGAGWTSGYYLAKLILTGGPHAGSASYIPFVVRGAPGDSSAILVQAGVNTWQAYNAWGGKSLYTFNSSGSKVTSSNTNAASAVSFDRPELGSGQGPLEWDFNIIRFLEKNGYDVSYQADTDTDQNPASLLSHRLDIDAGHDEYWTKGMRDAWDGALSAGVNLAFIGANDGYWQARYADPSDRALIEFRSAALDPDPVASQKTVLFRQLSPSRPECQLEGEGDLAGLSSTPANPNFGLAPNALSNPWFAGTGFTQSTSVTGVVGYEWDTAGQPGCPSVHTLFTWTGTNTYGQASRADASTFTAHSGARVFAAGTLQFPWALDDLGHTTPVSPQLQEFSRNMLDDLAGLIPPAASGPSPVTLRSPASGALLWTPRPKLIWAASRNPASRPVSYLVSIDHRRAARTRSTSFAVPHDLQVGRHIWTVTAVDAMNRASIAVSRSFAIAPVRFFRRSRTHVLRYGFSLFVYCEHRCSARITIRLGHWGPAVQALRHSIGPGVARLIIPLGGSLRSRLLRSRSAQLFISVRTRAGHTTRSVNVRVPW
jgi:hypothetical protein